MLGHNEVLEVVQRTLADVLGVCETDVAPDALIQDHLGLETDDLEEVSASLQSAFGVYIPPDVLFPDDLYDQLTVESIVKHIEPRIGDV